MNTMATGNRNIRLMSIIAGTSLNKEEIVEEFQPPTLSRSSTSTLPSDTHWSADYDSDDVLYVAVPKDYKEGKSILGWALTYFPLVKKIILVHIHQPSQSLSRLPMNQLAKTEVQAYHQLEREKVDKALNDYTPVCRIKKVQVEKLIVDNSDVAKGLLELITSHAIQKLVMGAASDWRYSKDMKKPQSSLACILNKKAQPLCQIWFVCKGNLICTREVSPDYSSDASPLSCFNSKFTQSEPSLDFKHNSGSPISGSSQSYSIRSSLDTEPHETLADLLLEQSQDIYDAVHTGGEKLASSSGSTTTQTGRNSEYCHPVVPSRDDAVDDPHVSSVLNEQRESEDQSLEVHAGTVLEEDPEISSACEKEDLESDALYKKLQQVLSETAKLKDEAHAESRRRLDAENEAVNAMRRAKLMESKYMRMRKEAHEELQREKQEVEKLKSCQVEMLEELHEAHEQRLDLEVQAKELEIKCAKETQLRKEAEGLLQRKKQEVQNLREHQAEISEELRKAKEQQLALELQERDNLLLENDKTLAEAKDLRQTRDISGSSQRKPSLTEFSYMEIYQATSGFTESSCIGVGGYGRVHKGFLRHTTVAIKLLDTKSLQGQDEFHREIEVLSRVRHPNLVTLIGACLEACALVYEFLPNGSLEDRLACRGNTPSLPWQDRTRICAEICSSLIFLHSNKPESVVHGDLKPANILLDSNFTCKIGDFGISRILTQSSTTTTLYRQTDPKGTFHYMDPEFGTTGMLTPKSDIFSFGVIILRLLTGKEPHGIVRVVNEALNFGQLDKILDTSAGDWPFIQAQQLANLGIRCCEMNRKNRPDLVQDVWRILEPMKNASSKLSILGSSGEDRGHTPPYFICPIFQEIMKDPHIAADGFTYEAEAMKGWIESGHGTSPMTNLKLENDRLIPNHTLRSAIQEWLQKESISLDPKLLEEQKGKN